MKAEDATLRRELVRYRMEDPENVEAGRAAVGLPPLKEKTAELKARVTVEKDVQTKARRNA